MDVILTTSRPSRQVRSHLRPLLCLFLRLAIVFHGSLGVRAPGAHNGAPISQWRTHYGAVNALSRRKEETEEEQHAPTTLSRRAQRAAPAQLHERPEGP